MTRVVQLPQATRVFSQRGNGSLLARAGWAVEAGSTIEIGDPQIMAYDHRDQMAVPFDHEGARFWLLVCEMKIPELSN